MYQAFWISWTEAVDSQYPLELNSPISLLKHPFDSQFLIILSYNHPNVHPSSYFAHILPEPVEKLLDLSWKNILLFDLELQAVAEVVLWSNNKFIVSFPLSKNA